MKSTCVCIFFLNIELKQFCNILLLIAYEAVYLLISICCIEYYAYELCDALKFVAREDSLGGVNVKKVFVDDVLL